MPTIQVPMNRVEGDLEIKAEIDGGVVTRAWCSGTMYRGFERIMIGRGPLDGLVITPRICGICTTSHLLAAASALDDITHAAPPPDAVRLRNVALLAEHAQSDVRQAMLMFAADFVNPAHGAQPLFDDAVRRFAPFRGSTIVDTVRETKTLLEIVAILGGQWPHSSFMVPGGIVSLPSEADLMQCRLILRKYRSWYERRILGCTIDRFAEMRTLADLDAWLDEQREHADGELGFFIRYARALKLDQVGRGHATFLSYGSLPIPEGSSIEGRNGSAHLVPPGFLHQGILEPFDPMNNAEHVRHAWYIDYDGGRHPFEGETKPYASGDEGTKYSWAKAPRYAGQPAETGPLAEMLVSRHPLLTDIVATCGVSAFARQLARLLRPTVHLPVMDAWLRETDGDAECYRPPGEVPDGDGAGLCHAARGALGHWVKIRDGAISSYQIITPTAWNASPQDCSDTPGPMEQALLGTPVADPANPVELGHVVRSFDPCLVCTVHTLRRGRTTGSLRVGLGP